MRNLSVIALIFSVYLLSGFNNVFAVRQDITVGPFSVSYDSGPYYYEDGVGNFWWSVNGGLDPGVYIEFSIVSTKARVAEFSKGQGPVSSNWNGSDKIVPRSEGKFTFKIKVWKDALVRYSKDIPMEVKYRTVYALEGSDNIIAGVKTNYSITPNTNIRSVNWSVSNSSVKTNGSTSPSVVLETTSSGSVTLTGEILLTTGDKKTVKKTITIQDAVLNIDGNGGVVKSILGTPEVKYQLSGVPSGAKITWQTDNEGARIISGQGTGTVKLDVDDIPQFRLSVTAEYGSIKKTLTKDIKVVEFLLDNMKRVSTSQYGCEMHFDAKFIDIYTKKDIEGKAEWGVSFNAGSNSFFKIDNYSSNADYVIFYRTSPRDLLYFHDGTSYCHILFVKQNNSTKLPIHFYYGFPKYIDNYLEMKAVVTTSQNIVINHEFIIYHRWYDVPVLAPDINFKQSSTRSTLISEETENITSFDNNSESDIVVYNLQGQLVYSQKKVINFDIYSAPLQTGVYIIKKTDSHGKVETKKVRKN
ncbi:MAG: T9SS type A sorting domain-containing protein [Dysgonomonas sp.]|nr:T9SS type A sorting domain-containing protein [Dysgonomonas sp.]